MKLEQLYILAIVMAFFSCQNQGGSHTQVDSSKLLKDSSTNMASSLAGCYEYHVGRDTIRLSLLQDGLTVSGSLLYDMYEKDKSRATSRVASKTIYWRPIIPLTQRAWIQKRKFFFSLEMIASTWEKDLKQSKTTKEFT